MTPQNYDLFFEVLHGSDHYFLIMKEAQQVSEMKSMLEQLIKLESIEFTLMKRGITNLDEWSLLQDSTMLTEAGFDHMNANSQAPAVIAIRVTSEGDEINVTPVSIPPPLPESMQNIPVNKMKRKLDEELILDEEEVVEETAKVPIENDFFTEHFYNHPEEIKTENGGKTVKVSNKIAGLQGCKITQYLRNIDEKLNVFEEIPLEKFGHFSKVVENFRCVSGKKTPGPKEVGLLQIMGRYCDLYEVSQDKDYRICYLLHIANHIKRNRALILKNNDKLLKAQEEKVGNLDDVIEECRDQGFSRTKILIIVPYKKCALEIVDKLKDLYFGKLTSQVEKYKQFKETYGDDGTKFVMSANGASNSCRGDDYVYNMEGNTEDNFRIGITMAKKTMKLYTRFETSDIILASPLGLVQSLEDAKDECANSFLSSIDIAIFDEMDIIQMQNLENIWIILDNLNKLPDGVKTVDVTRIRNIFLEGHGGCLRQTMMFSRYDSAEIRSAFGKHCQNYAGYVTVMRKEKNVLGDIEVQVSQEMNRFKAVDTSDDQEKRFEYFTTNIFPKIEKGTCIFISSYYDYVKVKAHLVANHRSFADLCEYAEDKAINREKIHFQHDMKSICLITERFHYYKRFNIKGIKTLIFYQLPSNPHFVSQMINMSELETPLVTRIIFSPVDSIRLANIYGTAHAKELLNSPKNYHVLLSQ
uniref:U3 small nucleolar RNA-associated protein 25 homolog n=1 Tax=Rhabditophanes sp. KR3021 TaxID=114890 RepID=A0AC35TU81_9BILA